MSEDLKKIDVPTLIMHGDVDQIVPIRECLSLVQAHPGRDSEGVSWCTPRPDLDL
jgi:pimeloyl-ACP methyl ester carboxylesterase